MTLKNVIEYVTSAVIIILVVLLMMVGASAADDYYNNKAYPEVIFINNHYSDTLASLGIPKIEHHDWQEAAFSLGVTASNLTIDMFMEHLYMKYDF